MNTNASGTVCYDADFTPFGYERAYTTTCTQNYKFPGMERDSETGNDHAWFRNYEENLGRWMSPDPAGGDVTNPQSLNRYAYVLNNPTSLTDPLGLLVYCPTGETDNECNPDSSPSDDNNSLPWLDNLIIYEDVNEHLPSPGDSRASGGGSLDISETWQSTFACSETATQLMSSFQSNMNQFAGNSGFPFASQFPRAINLGDTLTINVGLHLLPSNFAAMKGLEVSVTSVTPNSFMFQTNPQQHFFNGTIAFMASDAGNGNVNFDITANANLASKWEIPIAPLIELEEGSTWNNLLNNLRNHCHSGGN